MLKRFLFLALTFIFGLVAQVSAKPAATKPIKPSATKPVSKPTATKPPTKPATKPVVKPNPKTPKTKDPEAITPEVTAPPTPEVAVPEEPKSRTWALLVGVGKYQSRTINTLRYPATDATGIRDALLDGKLGNVPAANIRLLVDEGATKSAVQDAVQNFLKPNVKSGDQVIIFLAGHGVAKGVGARAKSFLLPTDTRGLSLEALENTAVDLRELSNEIGALPASQFVIFVDACREDPAPGRGLKGNLQSDVLTRSVSVVPENASQSSVSFFACSIGQRAFEDPNLEHGVFTHWILQGIKTGAVPQRPDGAIDMARLTSYVSQQVRKWAKESSDAGDDAIEQSPEAVTTSLAGPVVLMRVKRDLPDAPVDFMPSKLTVFASPDSATITLDGRKIGVGVGETELAGGGDYKVRVEVPGYAPVEKSVKVWDGYAQQISVELQAARGVVAAGSTPTETTASELYQKARVAEERGQIEVALPLYQKLIAESPAYAPGYESLASLQTRSGTPNDALSTLIQMSKNAPSSHTSSLLSLAYARWALKNTDGKKTKKFNNSNLRVPENATEAAALSALTANDAVKQDATSSEAQAALGFSFITLNATDQGKRDNNKRDSLAAFGRAVAFDDKNAANHYGYGYGIRYFANFAKDNDKEKEVRRAVEAQKQAIALRPEYYDAHRERAICYQLLGESDEAIEEFKLAEACRGDASDPDDVAGSQVALAALHGQEAQNSTGEEKQQHEAESAGYLADAKETSNDEKLIGALRGLQMVGLGGSLGSFLPTEFSQVLGAMQDPRGTAVDKIKEKIPFGLPF